MLAMSFWELANFVVKFVNLAAMASVLGGGFSYFLMYKLGVTVGGRHLSYMRWGALTGLLATPLYFFIQVGSINQAGLPGLFDYQIARILADSGVGISSILRILGYVLGLLVVKELFSAHQRGVSLTSVSKSLLVAAYLLSAVLLTGSFPYTGHTVELGPAGHIAISAHVMAVFAWIGALFPLVLATQGADIPVVQRLMKIFGNWALLIVAVLVASGIYLSLSLIDLRGELLRSAYGSAFLSKLIIVACLLLLAASNKFQIVPKLGIAGFAQTLRQTITVEIVLAILVLVLTAYFTSVAIGSHG